MRRCPHRGFCLASRWTSSRISSGIAGRPAVPGEVHFARGQAPVPGEQGAWRHDPMQLTASGQQPRQRGDDGAVGPVRLRAGDLTAQDRDLVPQHQDLRVFRGIAPRALPDEGNGLFRRYSVDGGEAGQGGTGPAAAAAAGDLHALSQGAFPGFVQDLPCVRLVAGQPEVGPAQPADLPGNAGGGLLSR
jgi:hypothetical protein